MKKKNASLVIVGLVVIFAIVALFVNFANVFKDPSYYTVFTAMFGSPEKQRPVIPVLVVALCLEILGIIIPFFALPLDKKGQRIVFLTEIVVLLGAIVIFFFTPTLYAAANPVSDGGEEARSLELGTGTICTITFACLAVAASFLGFMSAKKED
jgi:MFS family permease